MPVEEGRELIAVDVAVLLPAAVAGKAAEISRELADDQVGGLCLDEDHLPHITLIQQFVRCSRLDELFSRVAGILASQPPLRLRVSQLACRGETVTLGIEHNLQLQRLHQTLLAALAELAGAGGDASCFMTGGEAIRPRDVEWVTRYRNNSSSDRYWPHVTLGHGKPKTPVEPFDFAADRVAVCHLGRFCTCRAVLREWRLTSLSRGRDPRVESA